MVLSTYYLTFRFIKFDDLRVNKKSSFHYAGDCLQFYPAVEVDVTIGRIKADLILTTEP